MVLEFDHQRNMEHSISWLVCNKWKFEVLKAEIAKCEVRCANRHRRKTAKDFGYRRLKAGAQKRSKEGSPKSRKLLKGWWARQDSNL